MGSGESYPKYPSEDGLVFNTNGELDVLGQDSQPYRSRSIKKEEDENSSHNKKRSKKKKKKQNDDETNPNIQEEEEENKNPSDDEVEEEENKKPQTDEIEEEENENPKDDDLEEEENPRNSKKKKKKNKSKSKNKNNNNNYNNNKKQKPPPIDPRYNYPERWYNKRFNHKIVGCIDENVIDNPTDLEYHFSCTQTLTTHKNAVTCLIELSNQDIASSSLDNTIIIWTKGNQEQFTVKTTLLGHNDGVLQIKEFSSHNVLGSVSIDKAIILWDLTSYKKFREIRGHALSVLCLDFSIKYNTIATGSDDKSIRIWSFETGKTIMKIYEHKRSVSAVCFIDNFKYLCSGSDDKTLKIFDIEKNYSLVKSLNTLGSEIDCIKYEKNRLLVSCEDGNIYFIEISMLKRIRSVQFSPFPVHDFLVLDNEKLMAVASSDCKGRVWKIGSDNRTLLEGHREELNGIVLIKDGRLVTCSNDATIKVWQAVYI